MLEKLKEEVRRELSATACEASPKLQLIDAIQRLGVAYQFDEEIKNTLKVIYDNYSHDWPHYNDLYDTALWFRLLHQQGFNVSSGETLNTHIYHINIILLLNFW